MDLAMILTALRRVRHWSSAGVCKNARHTLYMGKMGSKKKKKKKKLPL